MRPESDGPFYGREQEFYRSAQTKNANGALTSQQRKIDPMGMMGKIFASVGAILVVIGVLIASLLGWFASGGFGFYFATLAGAWGTGLLFLLLGLAQLLFFRNVGSANVVEQYFMAFVNQDYMTAFQCLDPGIKTRQNELDTQTWFIRRAQAYDENGKITDYVLKGFNLNSKSAKYTIKVIRGTGPYAVHLSLLKKGYSWKISGFDLF
jgi:hypothetical protein